MRYDQNDFDPEKYGAGGGDDDVNENFLPDDELNDLDEDEEFDFEDEAAEEEGEEEVHNLEVFEEGCYDDFEDEEDEGEEPLPRRPPRKREPKPPPPPYAVVPDDDPALLELLAGLLEPGATVEPLVAWLAERGDPRSADVAELWAARCAIPAQRPATDDEYPMAAGAWWVISRVRSGVAAYPYPRTPQARVVEDAWDDDEYAVTISSRKQTPAALQQAFVECRWHLLFGLFRVDAEVLLARQRFLRPAKGAKPTAVLHMYQARAVPWVVELHGRDPRRFARLMKYVWSHPELHEVGYGIMDGILPDWRQKLPSLLDAPGGGSEGGAE